MVPLHLHTCLHALLQPFHRRVELQRVTCVLVLPTLTSFCCPACPPRLFSTNQALCVLDLVVFPALLFYLSLRTSRFPYTSHLTLFAAQGVASEGVISAAVS